MDWFCKENMLICSSVAKGLIHQLATQEEVVICSWKVCVLWCCKSISLLSTLQWLCGFVFNQCFVGLYSISALWGSVCGVECHCAPLGL